MAGKTQLVLRSTMRRMEDSKVETVLALVRPPVHPDIHQEIQMFLASAWLANEVVAKRYETVGNAANCAMPVSSACRTNAITCRKGAI